MYRRCRMMNSPNQDHIHMGHMKLTIEWLRNKIDHLSLTNSEIEKRDELDLIEIKLKSLTTSELDTVVFHINIFRFFSHITSTKKDDKETIVRLCNILMLVLGVLNPAEIYQQFSVELTEHLSHHDSAVKKLVLTQLDRMAVEQNPGLLTDIHILKLIMDRIGDDDIDVANIAMKIMKTVGKESRSLKNYKITTLGVLQRIMATMVAKRDAVSFRVYEVIIDLSKSSKQCFRALINSGLIDSLINILDNDDILLQLNALDLLGDLATNDAGLNYMEERKLLSDLDKKISRASEDPLCKLLLPGLIKFFGNIAKNHPNEIFTKYPSIIQALFNIIEAPEDMVILMNALDTLGHVASTVDGKYALDNLHSAMPSAVKKMKNFINELPTEVRLRALESLALILHVDEGNHNNRVLLLTKSWFDLLDDDPVTFIVNLCKQPFPDIRLSSMKVLLEVASQYWGQEYIATHPGLLEFLMNRHSETDSECKFVKYEIVKALVKADCFDVKTIEQLNEYVRAVPLTIDIDTEVATESDGNA